MKRRELLPGIEWVGAVDWDRRLFDALIPLPDGTSYNAYLVKGRDRTALIDTVDPTKADALWEHLADVARVDDLVIQHVEQDHSGLAPEVVARYEALGARIFRTDTEGAIQVTTDGSSLTVGAYVGRQKYECRMMTDE